MQPHYIDELEEEIRHDVDRERSDDLERDIADHTCELCGEQSWDPDEGVCLLCQAKVDPDTGKTVAAHGISRDDLRRIRNLGLSRYISRTSDGQRHRAWSGEAGNFSVDLYADFDNGRALLSVSRYRGVDSSVKVEHRGLSVRQCLDRLPALLRALEVARG